MKIPPRKISLKFPNLSHSFNMWSWILLISMLYLGRGKQPKAFELITYLIHLIYCSLNFKIQISIKCRFFLSSTFLIASFLCKIMLVKRVIKRTMFGMVKYLHPILVNFQAESYEKQIFKNHCTKKACRFNLGFSHHCSFAVYRWRHLNDPILAILLTWKHCHFYPKILHKEVYCAGLLK